MRRSPARSRSGGFSLIELMVVMLIVSMLFAVVGVSVSRSVRGAEIRNASRDIVAGIRHTRGQAIIQRQQQVFHVDADARSWTAAGRDAVELPEGLDITIETARSELTGENAGGIRFYPDGASTGGSVELLAGERTWTVEVSWLTGEVSLKQASDDV
ncbi:GspH/FimT family pseudopilin [Wenzhouxiangella sp. EGI_FJ10409]|uniref:GspH/FimT family pseudopilin n=1 Tax=Wenzhouxiangella sp. EGI_FJ10409 TaxID=3243767 RepID=UPI0035DFDBFA